MIGWSLATALSDVSGARFAAVAAGGIIAMLTNSLMPFAFRRGHRLAGVATVLGFGVSIAGSG